MSARVLFHVQHLLGIGHLQRAAALARGLQEAGLATTVLSGGEPVGGVDFGGTRIVQLPPARATDTSFKHLVDADGRPLDADFHERRRALALETFAAVRPDVVLIETYPFGRRAFRGELTALIDAAHGAAWRPRLAVSIRDIVVAKTDPRRIAEILATVGRVDAVLVHGDPELVPLTASFPAAAAFVDKIRYTGYVAAPAPARALQPSGEVVVSAGGGAVGGALLRTTLAARPLTRLAAAPWRLLTGPNLPAAEVAALRAAAPAGVTVERFRADFPALLAAAAVSVSQAGYNTVLDILAAGVRAVVVPFAAGAETEQSLRAEILAGRGVLTVVAEAALTPPILARAIDEALARPPRRLMVAGDGAARTAALIRALAARATVSSSVGN